jgi:DNA-binding CsgD family transcriptional regulator
VESRAGDVFVGRARELEELGRALEATAAGGGATVLIEGEAGIGKTRLASELATRAGAAGFEILLGRSIDLVGTELPYQPLVEALRPLGGFGRAARSQLRVFEETLALLSDRAAAQPVLLVLEDLHWADTSTLDLVVFLAHNLDDRAVLLLATCRVDEPSSADRVRQLAVRVRRSGSALLLELGPLQRDELTALLAARADALPPASVTEAIVARCEGNPFFAEELLAAAGDRSGELPPGLRDLLLQRVGRLDRRTQGALRVAAAAGRDVSYPLLSAAAALPENEIRDSLREAVDHGVLVADQETGGFRFRHALLAEAIYATILPGEREELHARLAGELVRSGAAGPAELAPHWAAAGRSAEALVASVAAAEEAEAVFGLAEAHAHLERAVALWPAVPGAADLVRRDLVELCVRAADLAWQTGAAPRAVELAERAIELLGDGDPVRAALVHGGLSRYLHTSGRADAALAAFERAVDLVPAEPPSRERARVLAGLGNGLSLAWRYEESRRVCLEALAMAREVGARPVELIALPALGIDLAYLGRADEGLAQLRLALELAEESSDAQALEHAYVALTDVLTMLGRPRESARVAATALEAMRRYGIDHTTLVANRVEALMAAGEWDEADALSAAALRAMTANYPHQPLIIRADLEIGRGEFDAARAHLEAAAPTVVEDAAVAYYNAYLCELALWERRWADAEEAAHAGVAHAHSPDTAQIRVWLCAKGLRAQAELVALARARRDAGAVERRLRGAGELLATARSAAADASAITPNIGGWLALAEAEHGRAGGDGRPDAWAAAAAAWDRLERPPVAAYCRWREAEALAAAGASRVEASVPLREAHAVATRMGAIPLAHELELLAQRARLDLASPQPDARDRGDALEEILGLTPRETEVLSLVARGYTDREIAEALVISAKTASVHVSHILRKLDAPNRREAAAIAHRLAPPPAGRR